MAGEAERGGSGAARARVEPTAEGARIALEGRLDADGVAALWQPLLARLAPVLLAGAGRPARVRVDAAGVVYLDGAGAALLVELGRRARAAGGALEVEGLAERYGSLLERYGRDAYDDELPARRLEEAPLVVIGRAGVSLWADLRAVLTYVGRISATMAGALLRPRRVRWRELALVLERSGVDALPIVCLISFLMGVILAYQSALPMQQFGAEIFVADLVALSMLRELGPLMTAIVLTGRSGSAFAAELGTMRVNEEVDALDTMGVDPVRYLVVPRGLAAVIATPLLTVFANLCGLYGGGLVMTTFGTPLVGYTIRVRDAVEPSDLLGGLAKAVVFGAIVAGVGCVRGLQATSGPAEVGRATTRAVVSGIVLIVSVDMLFAVLYHYLGL